MGAKNIKDLDQYLTKKTGASADQRQVWRDAIDEQSRLRAAATTDADRKKYGEEQMRIFNMGPGSYIASLNARS